MCREAYIPNAESSRRIEKVNNHEVRPSRMLKKDNDRKCWKGQNRLETLFKLFDIINIDFWSRKIAMADDENNL